MRFRLLDQGRDPKETTSKGIRHRFDFKDPVLNIRGSINTEIGDLRNYLPKDSADLLAKIGEKKFLNQHSGFGIFHFLFL